MKHLSCLFLLMSLFIWSRPATASAQTLELLETDPEAGSVYSLVYSEGKISFRFSEAIEADSAVLVMPDQSLLRIAETSTSDFFYHYFVCYPAELIRTLLTEGTLKAGDTFGVRLYGVHMTETPEVIYGTDGIVEVSYVAEGLPTQLVGITPAAGSTILSKYAVGNEAGHIRFEFDGALSKIGDAVLYYGNREEGSYGEMTVSARIEDKSVVVDLTGLDLSPKALNNQTAIDLVVRSVCAESGALVSGNSQGSPGTVHTYYDILHQTEDKVYGGFEGSIDAASIECWLSDRVTFDAVHFQYTLDGVTTHAEISASQTVITSEPDDTYPNAMLIQVPLTDLTFDAGSVHISLTNAQDSDDNQLAIVGTFKSAGRVAAGGPKCLSVSPASGALLQRPADFTFWFNTAVEVSEAIRFTPSGDTLALTPEVAHNVVTFPLQNNAVLSGEFTYSFVARLADGSLVTYGDVPGRVTAHYEVPADLFVCTSIVSATAESDDYLSSWTLTFAHASNPAVPLMVGGFDAAKPAVLLDADSVVVATATFAIDETNPQQALLSLPSPFGRAGTYTLVIPEGAVFNELYDAEKADFGIASGAICNPVVTMRYTLQGTSSLESVSQSDGTPVIYNMQGVRQPSSSLHELPAGIYVVGNKVIAK